MKPKTKKPQAPKVSRLFFSFHPGFFVFHDLPLFFFLSEISLVRNALPLSPLGWFAHPLAVSSVHPFGIDFLETAFLPCSSFPFFFLDVFLPFLSFPNSFPGQMASAAILLWVLLISSYRRMCFSPFSFSFF